MQVPWATLTNFTVPASFPSTTFQFRFSPKFTESKGVYPQSQLRTGLAQIVSSAPPVLIIETSGNSVLLAPSVGVAPFEVTAIPCPGIPTNSTFFPGGEGESPIPFEQPVIISVHKNAISFLSTVFPPLHHLFFIKKQKQQSNKNITGKITEKM